MQKSKTRESNKTRESQKIKVAINGFGRIGRAFFRQAMLESKIEIVAINDIKNPAILAYLAQNDSIYHGTNFIYNDSAILINNQKIPLTRESSFKTLNGAEIVIESSGANLTRESLQSYLAFGANRVILSAPPRDNMPIFIFGVNECAYKNEAIFSNASCTSNAIAPIISAILTQIPNQIIGINISTIHPSNSDQSLLDSPHAHDLRLSRNAMHNIIPTQSTIGAVLERVFGAKVGGIYGDSIRVPTSIVAFSNIDILFSKKPSLEAILALQFDKNIISFDENFRTSSDFIGATQSAIIARDLVKINGNIARLGIWFDNEWAYARRLLDMILWINR